MPSPWEGILEGEEATERFGRGLAMVLPTTLCIGLSGALGAGKTRFSRAFVGALEGGARARVASPTYAICHHYRTRPRVWHLDLYRLSGADDLESVAFFELLGSGIVLVEWPERVSEALDALDVHVQLSAERARSTRRTFRVEAKSDLGAEVLRAWRAE